MDGAVTRPSSDAGGKRLRVSGQTTVVQYEWRGARVIGAQGAYDLHSITHLADALGAAAKESAKVILDASGITFADSTLLNLLILTHRTADLRVVAPAQPLQRLLELTGVDTVLKVRRRWKRPLPARSAPCPPRHGSRAAGTGEAEWRPVPVCRAIGPAAPVSRLCGDGRVEGAVRAVA